MPLVAAVPHTRQIETPEEPQAPLGLPRPPESERPRLSGSLGDALKNLDTRRALTQRTVEASILLDREVNVTRYTREKLEARRTGGFLSSVLAGPKQWLVGDETVLQRGGTYV